MSETNDDKVLITKAQVAGGEDSTIIRIESRTHNLYPSFAGGQGAGLMSLIQKEATPGQDGRSSQGVNTGIRAHPFDFSILSLLKDHNEHHATCLSAKVSATVGLGFLNEAERKKKTFQPTAHPLTGQPSTPPALPIYQESKVDTVLDPFCTVSWNDVLVDVCEDFWETGNGYIEVVRDPGGNISGLHHLASKDTAIVVENLQHDFHYEIAGEGATYNRKFARFGDREELASRLSLDEVQKDKLSEVIHFRRPSSRSKWYGSPDWISAVAMIELAQMLHQFKFDFFNNRGVPEFMLFVKGRQLDKRALDAITDSIKATVGHGNSHKSVFVNIPYQDVDIQLERLAVEGGSGTEDFKTLKETIALSIVTAHKVPPLLAGIQIPGKLGATNELSQALIAFQSLVIGQAQRIFQSTLIRSLGTEDASLGLVAEDFVFRTITDDLDPAKMDTIGRMHQPLPQANAEGRDINSGVKD